MRRLGIANVDGRRGQGDGGIEVWLHIDTHLTPNPSVEQVKRELYASVGARPDTAVRVHLDQPPSQRVLARAEAVPGLGRPTLGRKARRFAAGLYQYRNTYVYVNKGVGFGWRFRFGVRPEVAVFTLKPM